VQKSLQEVTEGDPSTFSALWLIRVVWQPMPFLLVAAKGILDQEAVLSHQVVKGLEEVS
jgi:hypothetical protein